MIKTTNEHGKQVYTGAGEMTPFDINQFHVVKDQYDDDHQWALHATNIGNLTVLDRMTGFGHRDVETGYMDMNGEFWLASGGYDVRCSGAETLGEAIKWVKERANTCIGKEER